MRSAVLHAAQRWAQVAPQGKFALCPYKVWWARHRSSAQFRAWLRLQYAVSAAPSRSSCCGDAACCNGQDFSRQSDGSIETELLRSFDSGLTQTSSVAKLWLPKDLMFRTVSFVPPPKPLLWILRTKIRVSLRARPHILCTFLLYIPPSPEFSRRFHRAPCRLANRLSLSVTLLWGAAVFLTFPTWLLI